MKENTLYKVTKVQYERPYDHKTRTYGEYHPVKRTVDFRAHRAAVTLSYRYAEDENKHADRVLARNPNANPRRYSVDVEACEMPVFSPVVYCGEHGVQMTLNVPGLTTEPTCIECL